MSSSVQSFWYQIFEVAFLFLELFPTVFPCDRSEPQFFSRKGNWCPVIAQKATDHKSCPKSTSCCSSSREETGQDRLSSGWEQFMNLLLAYFLCWTGKRWHPGVWCHLLSSVTSLQLWPVGRSSSRSRRNPWVCWPMNGAGEREVVSKFRVPFCSEGKQSLVFLYREVGWIVIVG